MVSASLFILFCFWTMVLIMCCVWCSILHTLKSLFLAKINICLSSYCSVIGYVREVEANLTSMKLFKRPYLQSWNKDRKKINLHQTQIIFDFRNPIFIELVLWQTIVDFVSRKVWGWLLDDTCLLKQCFDVWCWGLFLSSWSCKYTHVKHLSHQKYFV